jgi:hypothetical protein
LSEKPLTEIAQSAARQIFRTPTLQQALERWWVKKYRLPSNHDLFVDRTLYDHLIDFYLDKFEQKPIEAHRNVDGEIQFKDTGDELVDRWEEQIAAGQIPDLFEAFDEESIRHLEKLKAAAAARDPYEGLSFKSTFDKISVQANSEGLTVGAKGNTPASHEDLKRALAEKLANATTFGFDPNDDE